jgi:hypothetical protein
VENIASIKCLKGGNDQGKDEDDNCSLEVQLVEQFAYVLETDEKKHKSANKKKTF